MADQSSINLGTNDQRSTAQTHTDVELRRREPARRTVFAHSGTYGESKEYQELLAKRKEQKKASQEVVRLQEEIHTQTAKCLKVCQSQRRWVLAEIQETQADHTLLLRDSIVKFLKHRALLEEQMEKVEQMLVDCSKAVSRSLIESPDDEVQVTQDILSNVRRQLCESVKGMIASVEAAITRKMNGVQSLQFPHREAQRNKRWSLLESAFEQVAVDYQDFTRGFSDTSAKIARWLNDSLMWYDDYSYRLSGHNFEQDFRDGDKESMYQIRTLLLEMFEGLEQTISEAHFARLYRRVGRLCSLEPNASRYMWKHAHLEFAASKSQLSAKALKMRILRGSNGFWFSRSPSDSIYHWHFRPNRLTDLGVMIHRSASEIVKLVKEFYFGVLSNDHASTIQLRRAQAATLVPFLTVFDGWGVVFQELARVTMDSDSTINLESIISIHRQLRYARRDAWFPLNWFAIVNWMSNDHRHPTRTAFLIPPSQPVPRLSPDAFSQSPGYGNIKHPYDTDHSVPRQASIPVVYCRNVVSVDSTLRQLRHNSIISIDVRWVAAKRRLPGTVPDWFGHEVSVITLSTPSQVVVCHLALHRQTRHDHNIPNSLRTLLEDSRIIKVGLDMVQLQQRFARYLNILMKGTLDVGSLHASLQSISPAGRRSRRKTDIRTMAKQCFGWDIPPSLRTGTFWLAPLSIPDLLGTVSEAHACLHLFFRLSQSMLASKSTQDIPFRGCSDDVVQNLSNVMPAAVISVSSEAHKEASPPRKPHTEAFYPILIPPGLVKCDNLTRKWAVELSKGTIEVLPELKTMRLSLELYHLWRTLEWNCDQIESLLPQSQSNLPAVILEVIERGDLPYRPERYEALQKMALVQLNASVKISCIEEQTRISTVQEWSQAKLEIQISFLMALLREKIKAAEWLDVMLEKGQIADNEKSRQDLLQFAMWHTGQISVEHISKLLLQPRSRTAEAILNGARRAGPGVQLSDEALRDVARMTEDEGQWLNIIQQIAHRAARMKAQPNESADETITKTKKRKVRPLKTSPVVISSPGADLVPVPPRKTGSPVFNSPPVNDIRGSQARGSIKKTSERSGSSKKLVIRKTSGQSRFHRPDLDMITPLKGDGPPTLNIRRQLQRIPQDCLSQPTSESPSSKSKTLPPPGSHSLEATIDDFVPRRVAQDGKQVSTTSEQDTKSPQSLSEMRFTMGRLPPTKKSEPYSSAKLLHSSFTHDSLVISKVVDFRKHTSPTSDQGAGTLSLSEVKLRFYDPLSKLAKQDSSAQTPFSNATVDGLIEPRVNPNRQAPLPPKRPIKATPSAKSPTTPAVRAPNPLPETPKQPTIPASLQDEMKEKEKTKTKNPRRRARMKAKKEELRLEIERIAAAGEEVTG